MPALAAPPSPTSVPAHRVTAVVKAEVVKADAKSGRLIRSIVLQPRLSDPAPIVTAEAVQPDALLDLIDTIATEQGVEKQLVHSVIRAESNYNPYAVSPKGALGIMQLIPSTARRFGVANAFDPGDNIRGGVRYLRFLLDYYQGDYPKAIAAYNAGEGAVDKYNGIPPYTETQNYVYRVARNLKAARQSTEVTNLENEPGKTETPRQIETSTGSDGRIYYRTP